MGVLPDDLEDPEEIWRRVLGAQEKVEKIAERRSEQRITIPGDQPFGLAFLSDLHFGNMWTDYRQARKDADLVRDTEGLYAIFTGDGIDNWITGKLMSLQRDQVIPFDHEVRLFKDWLSRLKQSLLVTVSGNHENWTKRLAGFDFVREYLKGTRALYDRHEVVFTLILGDAQWVVKVRHKWRWGSVFNPTHGIEVGWERTGHFDIGVGGHTHIGTLIRPFLRDGTKRYAVLVGTYKTGGYGRELGLAKPYGRGAAALIFYPDGRLFATEDLQTAIEFLSCLRSK